MLIGGIAIGAAAVALIWALSGIFSPKRDWPDCCSCEELFTLALEASGLRRIHDGELRRGEYTVRPMSGAYTLIKIAPALLWEMENIITIAFDHAGNLYAIGADNAYPGHSEN